MKILITGSAGLLGWQVRCFLHGKENVSVTPFDIDEFQDDAKLSETLGTEVDAIIHLAGLNRAETEEEVATKNVAITNRLIAFLEATDATPHVVFSSSTQIDKGTPYGNSKAACADLLQQWASRASGRFSNVVFPHLFGEGGKPFYNSVTSTFCHLLATGGEPEIHVDSELNLLHCQDAAALIFRLIQEKHEGEIRPEGHHIMVSDLLEEIKGLADAYRNQLLPDLTDPFRLRMFNTYRSYLRPEDRAVPLEQRTDERGSLFEAVRSLNAGQTFFSTTKPGITRGNHYHTRKVERFLVVKGRAVIRMRRLFSDQVLEFPVDGNEPCYVDMPTLFTHNITNIGSGELMTLFWANEIFNPDDTDTFFEVV